MQNAVRIAAAELIKQPAEIMNRISAEADGARQETLDALEAAICETHAGNYAAIENGFLVPTRWEPPFKMLRALSAKFPAARFIVKSDAFRSEYWVARAVFENGKQTVEDVLTMNDGEAFELLFKEIHNQSSAEWKKQNTQGSVRGGFAWGTADGFDASKSELGKAEGQA